MVITAQTRAGVRAEAVGAVELDFRVVGRVV